jgi:hypothetical protein
MAVVDSYSESHYVSSTHDLNSANLFGVGQSFTGDGQTLDTAQFYCKKTGSPTGNAVAKVYAHSGTFGTSSIPTGSALAASANFDVSTLTGSMALTTFSFSGGNRISLTNGTKYVVTIEYTGGNSSNNVNVGFDSNSPTHGGNDAYSYDLSAWTAQSAWDVIFYVYGVAGGGGGTFSGYRSLLGVGI